MTRPFQVEISESREELEKALKQVTTASSKERLQMLYLLKSGQVASRQRLAELIGRDQATITRWLRKYKDGGLKGLLEVKSAPGRVAIVSGSALERLKQRLQEPQGFHSYGQIQQWLALPNWDWTSPIKRSMNSCVIDSKPSSKSRAPEA